MDGIQLTTLYEYIQTDTHKINDNYFISNNTYHHFFSQAKEKPTKTFFFFLSFLASLSSFSPFVFTPLSLLPFSFSFFFPPFPKESKFEGKECKREKGRRLPVVNLLQEMHKNLCSLNIQVKIFFEGIFISQSIIHFFFL